MRRGPTALAAALAMFVALVGVALAASTDFVEPATSPEAAGTGPNSVAAGDLDGDTDVDLAVANFNSDNVTILKNGGAGNLSQPTSSPEAAGDGASSVVIADLDGDSDSDIAVANRMAGTITILKNSGSGNFSQPPSSPEVGLTDAVSVAAADLDGDTDVDLAVARFNSGNVTILKNNGTANFFEPGSSPETVGQGPSAVVAADADADADLDLAVANTGSHDVTILKNLGSGNFVERSSSPEAAGLSPISLAAGDLDGDADPDLAVPNAAGDDVTILKNNGTANFFEPRSSPETARDNPASVALADFDADTDLDLVVANLLDDNLSIHENTGSANFVEPNSSPEPTGPAGLSPTSVVAADFDGDGDSDLASANFSSNNVTILRNR